MAQAKWRFPTRDLPQGANTFTISSLVKSAENIRAFHIGSDGEWHDWSKVEGPLNCYLYQSQAIELSTDRRRYRVLPFGLQLYRDLTQTEIDAAFAKEPATASAQAMSRHLVKVGDPNARAWPGVPLMPRSPELDVMTTRFEQALQEFGSQCSDSLANEATFQIWIAVAMAREFGMMQVYREVHLHAPHLKELIEGHPFARIVAGNEIIPDLCIPWDGPLDCRHTLSRQADLRRAEQMLLRLAIITELKVTVSTSKPTPWPLIEKDLQKLAVCCGVYRSMIRRGDGTSKGLASYMMIVDNFQQADLPTPAFAGATLASRLAALRSRWPDNVDKPSIALFWPERDRMNLRIVHDFMM